MLLEALAKDRDGSVLTGDSLTWTSHLDGLLGRGAALALDVLTNLSQGEHIFTVVAKGSSGTTISALKRIQVNVAAGDSGSPGGDGGTEEEGEDLTLKPGSGFGPGRNIPRPPKGTGSGLFSPSQDLASVIFAARVSLHNLLTNVESRESSPQISPAQRTQLAQYRTMILRAQQKVQAYNSALAKGKLSPAQIENAKQDIIDTVERLEAMILE